MLWPRASTRAETPRGAELYVLDRYPKTTFGPWLQYENPTFELGPGHEAGVHGHVLVSLCNGHKPPSVL